MERTNVGGRKGKLCTSNDIAPLSEWLAHVGKKGKTIKGRHLGQVTELIISDQTLRVLRYSFIRDEQKIVQ